MNEIDLHVQKIIGLIENARQNALKQVNAELILLYWNVGQYLSEESLKSSWGDSIIDEIAKQIKEKYPELKGFTRRNLYRMRRFYITYKDNEFVPTVLPQISWSNHTLILSGAKSIEEKEFYIRLCIKEKYSARELQRQIDSGYYERFMLSSKLPVYEGQIKNLFHFLCNLFIFREQCSHSKLKNQSLLVLIIKNCFNN